MPLIFCKIIRIVYNIVAYATLPLFQLVSNSAGESRGVERHVPKNLVSGFLCSRSARVGIPDVGVLVSKKTEGITNKKHGNNRAFLVALLVGWASISQADLVDLTKYGDFKKIYFIPQPEAKNVEVRLLIPVGEVDRTGPEGLAHYLEHLVVWSADKVHGEGFRNREMNAWTSAFWTTYWNRGSKATFENMIRNARAVFEPLDLTQEFMLTERDVVEREFDLRYRDNPTAVIFREASHHLYGDHQLGRSVMGTPESIRQISPEDALAFHQGNYRPQSAYLLISGPLTKGEAISQIQKHLTYIPNHTFPDRSYGLPLSLPPQNGLVLHLPKLEREEVLIVGTVAAPEGISRRRLWFSLLLLEDILNSALQGGLSKPLYYASFTVTQISASFYMLPTGDIEYEFFFKPEDGVTADEAVTLFHDTLAELANSGVSSDTLAVIRDRGREQVLRLEKDRDTYAATIAQNSILSLGEALDIKSYHYELGQPSDADLTAILKAVAVSHFTTTAIAYPEATK